MSSTEHSKLAVVDGRDTLAGVLEELAAERDRQDAQWGEQNHRDGTGPEIEILPGWLARDLATAARNACQRHAEMGIVTWLDIAGEEAAEAFAEEDPARLRAELVQLGAVIVAWVQAIDRRSGGLLAALQAAAEQLPVTDPQRAAETLSSMSQPNTTGEPRS
ncbi:hypothetical protein AB0D59_01135 [Streptomyces sp. NPDC048417]|uniref:hypothetical protein n=1 Tax=Streptomyces sp. NPDC048417 TaxID=3155387 RepID=UPI00343CE6F7